MSKSIHHKVFYQHPPQIVWEYLTKPELIAQWLMQSDFKPIVGYDFQFKTRPLPNFNFDGIVYCKVLEVIPFKKLSYSWKGGPGNSEITLDSIVVWTLKEQQDGTELELLHTGFTELAGLGMYSAMSEGWLRNMRKIAELINSRVDDATNS